MPGGRPPALGRAGSYRVTLASPGGATVRAESGLVLGTVPLPADSERIRFFRLLYDLVS